MLSPHGSQTQSGSHPCLSSLLTVFTSMAVTGKPLDVPMGWEIRLLLIPCTWNKTARLNSHQRQETGEREGQLLQIRAENAGCCSFPET